MKLSPIKKDKRGVLGFETAKEVILTLLVLAVMVIAVFLALTTLNNAGIFTAGSQSANDTNMVINNITTGTVKFFGYIPTIFTILAIVVIILAIALILFAVNRFGGREGGL